MKINKHNLKLYSNEDLIELCRLYHHSKDIPRWLYQAIRHRNIQEIAMCHMTSLNPKRTLDEVRKEAVYIDILQWMKLHLNEQYEI